MSYRELHLRQVSVKQVHIVPGDDLFFNFPIEKLRARNHGLLKQGMQAAQNASHADFGAQKAQLRPGGRKLQVVYANDFQALRIDDLLVEQIARKKNLGGLEIAETNVVRLGVKTNLVFGEIFDVFAPADHERRATRPFECKRCNTRKDFARRNGEVRHRAELFTRRIVHGSPEHVRQIEHSSPSCAIGLWPCAWERRGEG